MIDNIDKDILDNLCKNEKIKNLINLSSQSEICIFNKRNKKFKLKSKEKLLKECNQIRKKEIKNSSSMLSNLAKLNNNDMKDIKNICNNLENKITTIDSMIDYINDIDSETTNYTFIPTIINIEEKYIECFSN